MEFTHKGILVTGASRGIGREIAHQFAEKGATVAVHYNQNKQAAQETMDSLEGDSHFLVQADMMDSASVKTMVDAVAETMGRIDILINNAGVYGYHPIPDTAYAEWQDWWKQTLGTNLIGAANVSYLVARHMMEKGGGRIVNVSSRGAFRGEPDAPAYGASKAGMNAMSQSMAKALAPHNIFVYAVAPGFVETEMAAPYLEGPDGDSIRGQSPMGRVARPEEVARTVLFLASEAPEFMTGSIVDINGASYLRT
jgi:NAD(P)-dependent dehydrogenase (short-subunit alcohol dehydrogenase family)